ncbi:hypothetical protein DLAC_09885 [Tieghemostelium lacteum]|uniref:RGS domain-containing protein n=1 Tax=Tieghemostelium lacteum TaxID=361077 RepID=A0A151Z5I6_TIELA|nr:hypothetical protein DLAC_09885 [Tieghemostelium lacteum]|eukprot:KYQ89230.1 hypothetical protein DLAC_09885 [Tieghemostelium lacteum]
MEMENNNKMKEITNDSTVAIYNSINNSSDFNITPTNTPIVSNNTLNHNNNKRSEETDLDISLLILNNNSFDFKSDSKDIVNNYSSSSFLVSSNNINNNTTPINNNNINLDISETVHKFILPNITTNISVSPVPTPTTTTTTTSINLYSSSYNSNNNNSNIINNNNSRSLSSQSLTSSNSRASGFYLTTPLSSSSSFSDISSISSCSTNTTVNNNNNINNNTNQKSDMSMGSIYQGVQGIVIDFSNRDLIKVPNRLPCEKDRIESFNSSQNKISIIPEDFFINFKILTTINFENNKIKSLPKSIKSVVSLQNIKLSNNKIKKFPKVFLSMPHLLTLDLSNNRIESLPKEINQISCLKELYIANNQIAIVPLQISELTLFIFSIENNPITYPPKEIIEQGFEALLDFIQEDKSPKLVKQKSNSNILSASVSSNCLNSSSNSINSAGVCSSISSSSSTSSSPANSSSPTSDRKSPVPPQFINSGFTSLNLKSNQTKDPNRLFTARGDSIMIQSTPTSITNTYYKPPKKIKPLKSTTTKPKDLMEIQMSLLQVPPVDSKPLIGSSSSSMITNCDSNSSTPTSNNQSTSPILDRIKNKIITSSTTISSISMQKESNKKSKQKLNNIIAPLPTPLTISNNNNINEIDSSSSSDTECNQLHQHQQSIVELVEQSLSPNNLLSTLPMIENINEYSKIIVMDSSNEFIIPLNESNISNNSSLYNSNDNIYHIDTYKEQHQPQLQPLPSFSKKDSDNSLKESTSCTFDDISLDDSSNSIHSSISSSSVSVNSLSQPTSPVPSTINYQSKNSGKSNSLGHHHGRILQSSKSSKSFFHSGSTNSKVTSSKPPTHVNTNRHSQQVFQKMAYMLSLTKPLSKVSPNTISHSYSKNSSNGTNIQHGDDLESITRKLKDVSLDRDSNSSELNREMSIPRPIDSTNGSVNESDLIENLSQKKFRERRGTISELDLKYNGGSKTSIQHTLVMNSHFKVINLIDIVKEESSREHFRSFLVTEFSQENLEFWVMVQHYKLLDNTERTLESEKIYSQYIVDGSVNQLNLPNICVRRIHDLYQSQSNLITLYDEAQLHIFKLMEMDSFERFKKSNLYFKCLTQSPSASIIKCNNLNQLLI